MKFSPPQIAATLLAATIGLTTPTAALAGQDTIVSSPISTTTKFGPRHSLNKVDALSSQRGSVICINAVNSDNVTLAGTTRCTSTIAGAYTYHTYCACQLRKGMAYSNNGGTSWGSAVQFW